MTLLFEAVEQKKLDTRVVERNMQRGVVSASDVEKATKNLPDDAENADWVTLEALAAEEDSESRSSRSAPTLQH